MPVLFSASPRLSPLGRVPPTPANTLMTSTSRGGCPARTSKDEGPAGADLEEKSAVKPVKEDMAEPELKLKKPNICPDKLNGMEGLEGTLHGMPNS